MSLQFGFPLIPENKINKNATNEKMDNIRKNTQLSLESWSNIIV